MLQKKKPTKFQVTERDLDILKALERYRYLRTGQIARLLFPGNTTLQSARRRLRYLCDAKYIGKIQPYVQIGKDNAETAYFLRSEGAALTTSPDEIQPDDAVEPNRPKYAKTKHVRPIFLQHALDVSEFRLNLELAVHDVSNIELQRFVADFELKAKTDNANGKRRYRLFDEVLDPTSRRMLVVYPDAMFILRALVQSKSYQYLYFVEIDRGTEGLSVIERKLAGYNLYQQERIFQKYGKFQKFRVLIQTNSQRRKTNIVKLANAFADHLDVWVSVDTDSTPDSILREAIWADGNHQLWSIVKNNPPKEPKPPTRNSAF